MAGFEDLEVWKRSVELSAEVYRETAELRDLGFRDQITRSCLSIPSNIAEGLERDTVADKCKFLTYSRASCGEFRTQVVVGTRAGFIVTETANKWSQESKEISAMINGLIRSIRRN